MLQQQELPKVNLSDNRRKFLIVIQCGLLVGSSLLMLSLPLRVWSLGLLAVFIGTTALSAALHTTLALSIGNICQGKLDRLDERERAVRDRAFIRSFQIITAVVSLAWTYAVLAMLLDWWLPQANQIWMLLWLIGMLTYGLPTSVAAWNLKNLEE